MNGYALLLTAHVLLLVFWLGTDIGVFLGSFRLKDPRLSPEARLEIGRLTSLLDMGPRTGVILSIPTGLALAYSGGWARRDPALLTPPVLAVVAVLSLLWLAMVWRFFALQQAAARGRCGTVRQRPQLHIGVRSTSAAVMRLDDADERDARARKGSPAGTAPS